RNINRCRSKACPPWRSTEQVREGWARGRPSCGLPWCTGRLFGRFFSFPQGAGRKRLPSITASEMPRAIRVLLEESRTISAIVRHEHSRSEEKRRLVCNGLLSGWVGATGEQAERRSSRLYPRRFGQKPDSFRASRLPPAA